MWVLEGKGLKWHPFDECLPKNRFGLLGKRVWGNDRAVIKGMGRAWLEWNIKSCGGSGASAAARDEGLKGWPKQSAIIVAHNQTGGALAALAVHRADSLSSGALPVSLLPAALRWASPSGIQASQLLTCLPMISTTIYKASALCDRSRRASNSLENN